MQKNKKSRSIDYKEYLIKCLKNPEEAQAYLAVALEESLLGVPESLLLLNMAIDDVKLAGGIVLEYKNYLGYASSDRQAHLIHGQVLGIKDIVTFQAIIITELEKAFHNSVDDYLDWNKEKADGA